MNVLILGHYSPIYPRNAAIVRLLQSQGIRVIEAGVSLNRLTRIFALIRHILRIRFKRIHIDLIFVPMIDLETFPIAKLLAKLLNIPLIYDAFESRYSVWVNEQKHSQKAVKSIILKALESYAVRYADLILCDTKAHGRLFAELYEVSLDKFFIIYVCLNTELFVPNFKEPGTTEFVVQFIGYFHPLAGVNVILSAAYLLNDDSSIVFEVIGGRDRQKKEELLKRAQDLGLSNIRFYDPLPYAELQPVIQRADLCLGIFGDTDQAGRVIPNKVYQALAMGKAVVTRDSDAIREVFTPDVHILVVPANDPASLAEAIEYIKQNPTVRTMLAQNGHERFLEVCCQNQQGSDFVTVLRRLIQPI